MSKLRAIPQLPSGLDARTQQFLAALKENIEILGGQRGERPLLERSGDSMSGDLSVTGNVSVTGAVTATNDITSDALVYGKTGAIGGNTTMGSECIEVNTNGTGNRVAYIDFHGDDTYTDYGLRLLRSNGGPNTVSYLEHRGTGDFKVKLTESAPFSILHNTTERLRLDGSGRLLTPYQPCFQGSFSGYGTTQTNYVPYLNTRFNVGFTVDASNSKLTVPVAGRYFFMAHQLVSTPSGYGIYLNIKKNGSIQSYAHGGTLTSYDLITFCAIEMSASDYVEFYYGGTTSTTWDTPHGSVTALLLG